MNQKNQNAVELIRITKQYGDASAIRDISLAIGCGEFVTILGPSGCGKSTLLRLISGFTDPTSGDVRINGACVVGLPSYRRDTAMVFQDYALFPHRTVAQNIAFGLRMRRTDKREIAARVDEMLEMLGLSGFGQRRIDEISGGQAQRVALGRALIVRPAVLLLDEPLGALDLKLRKQMQTELKRIHRELGLTFVAVTHDQEEALTLSDRIAVMNAGRVEQFDTPETLYRRPASRFVADFVGAANLLEATVETGDLVTVQNRAMRLPPHMLRDRAIGGKICIAIRPEVISVNAHPPANGDCFVEVMVEEVLFSGAMQHAVGRLADGTQIVSHQSALLPAPERGRKAFFCWTPDTSWVVEA